MGKTQNRGRPDYYAYVSDEKVEMLRGSIPRQIRERIAVELKLDLKIVSASLSEKPTLEDRYQQARVVAEYLRNEDLVGSIEEPNEYFAGTMLMHWGPYGGYGDSSMVFFAGEQDDICVGLGGSMRHAIGVGTAETMHSASLTHAILAAFRKDADLRREIDPRFERYAELDLDQFILDGIQVALRRRSPRSRDTPPESMSFLARTLYEANSSSGVERAILGSPIYVAFAPRETGAERSDSADS